MSSEVEPAVLLIQQVLERTMLLVYAPLENQDMLWIAIPLLVATLFMTLYFARYKQEELGWNTAFGNTMVFLFVSISLVREMYRQGGSLDALFGNSLYFTISAGLAGAGVFLMAVTYFHLLPKRLAFFLFSAPPINVSVYVVMAVVYANVPTDYLTALAGFAFMLLILAVATILQFVLRHLGLECRVGQMFSESVEKTASEIEEELEGYELDDKVEELKGPPKGKPARKA